MTVESTARKQSFAGGQSALAFTFRALTSAPEDIKVKTVTSGSETLLAYTTDYTVTIETDGVGGTVHIVTSVGTTHTYSVYRETTNKQESDYDDYNQFPADTLETDLDKRTMIDQEQSEVLERSVKLAISSSLTGSALELPAPSAGFGFVWNTGADGFDLTDVPVADIATEASNYATSASTSATEAANSATSASTSATEAANSATTASTQATLAGNYATTASTEAALGSLYAQTTSTNVTASVLYATTCSTQAALAGNYATTASTQATLAGNYATSASTSATESANYATTSSTSATESGNYATSASTSATESANYATSASTSATEASNYATTASTAAATIPDPTGQTVADQIRVNAAQDAYELFTASGGLTAPTSTTLNGIVTWGSTNGTIVLNNTDTLVGGALTLTSATITGAVHMTGIISITNTTTTNAMTIQQDAAATGLYIDLNVGGANALVINCSSGTGNCTAINITNNAAGLAYFLTGSGGHIISAAVSGTQNKKIQCNLDGVDYYIPCYTG